MNSSPSWKIDDCMPPVTVSPGVASAFRITARRLGEGEVLDERALEVGARLGRLEQARRLGANLIGRGERVRGCGGEQLAIGGAIGEEQGDRRGQLVGRERAVGRDVGAELGPVEEARRAENGVDAVAESLRDRWRRRRPSPSTTAR